MDPNLKSLRKWTASAGISRDRGRTRLARLQLAAEQYHHQNQVHRKSIDLTQDVIDLLRISQQEIP
jgi:hypothetical protein